MPIITSLVDKLPVNKVITRLVTDIDRIAIHHSADEGNPYTWAQYHITPAAEGGPPWAPEGCPGICYHAAVMRDGKVYKTANDSTRTWGVAGMNRRAIHIVLQGNLAVTPPSIEQIASLLFLCQSYQDAYNIRIPDIREHGEWANSLNLEGWSTHCPGMANIGWWIRYCLLQYH